MTTRATSSSGVGSAFTMQAGPVLHREPRNSGGGIDLHRTPDHQDEVRLARGRLRLPEGVGRQRLTEEHDRRLEQRTLARRAARRALPPIDRVHLVARKARATVEADDGLRRTVELDDLRAARLLVQSVGVLGDHRPEASVALQRGDRVMGRVRLRVGSAVVEAVGPVLRRILSKCVDVGHLVGIEPGPEPALAPKMGNSALDRNAGTGKRDGRPRRPASIAAGPARYRSAPSSKAGEEVVLRKRSIDAGSHPLVGLP